MCDEVGQLMKIVRLIKLIEKGSKRTLTHDQYALILESARKGSMLEINGLLFDPWKTG